LIALSGQDCAQLRKDKSVPEMASMDLSANLLFKVILISKAPKLMSAGSLYYIEKKA
jgi:hypothetical protein